MSRLAYCTLKAPPLLATTTWTWGSTSRRWLGQANRVDDPHNSQEIDSDKILSAIHSTVRLDGGIQSWAKPTIKTRARSETLAQQLRRALTTAALRLSRRSARLALVAVAVAACGVVTSSATAATFSSRSVAYVFDDTQFPCGASGCGMNDSTYGSPFFPYDKGSLFT